MIWMIEDLGGLGWLIGSKDRSPVCCRVWSSFYLMGEEGG